MSVHALAPKAYTDESQPAAPGADTPAVAKNWKSRLAVNSGCGLTNVEITRLSTRLFAASMIAGGIGVVALAALGMVAWPIGFVAIPCAIAAAGSIWYSIQLNDYENPEELEIFRNEAARMNLDAVMTRYGWNDVLRFGILTAEQFTHKYRQQLQGKSLIQVMDAYESAMRHVSQCSSPRFDYQVPSPRESRGLWRTETATKTFETILLTYPLDKLEKYSIVEAGELNCLKALKREFDVIKQSHDQRVAQVEREFQASTVAPKGVYDQECARANLIYSNNYAVRELQSFEMNYARERQVVQEQQNRTKIDARARFDRAVSRMTNHGQIAYANLQPGDKLQYDREQLELSNAVAQADTTARVQIQGIDQRRHERLGHLNAEETRVRHERTGLIDAAKRIYDAAVGAQRQRKEDSLRPIDAAFRSSANDFNGRYRAYLRTIGVH